MRLSHFGATISALAFSAAAFAQAASEPSFTPERVRAHIEFLADDLLEGRDTGSRGHEIAARYVATNFEALGLKPVGADGGWYQQVPFQETRLGDAPVKVTIGGREFENGKDVLIGANSRELAQTIEAPVVFAGYGLDAPSQGLNDYAGLDVRGKFVAVLAGMPKDVPSEVAAHLNSEKGAMAEKRGALGVITLYTPAEEARRPMAMMAGMVRRPSISWVATDGKPFSRTPGIRLTGGVGTAGGEALFAGAPRTLASIFAAAEKGEKPKGFALKPSMKVERTSVARSFTSPNVVAVLPGSDPALANEYVLLMAHLDHVGVDESKEGDKIFNGAMDNASGIATMLEVARAMASAPNKPRRPILFAAVTGEEKGLLGSAYLSRNPVVGPGKVVGVVNLDMPILTYDFQDVTAFGAEHSSLGPIVARAGARMNVKLSPDPLPEERLFTRSDHYNFVREGVPSVFLMTGFAGEGKEKFTHFLATDYHKVSDQTDLPFNWDAGAKFARLNYLIAREIADADQAPRWNSGNFFGDTFAPGQPRATVAR